MRITTWMAMMSSRGRPRKGAWGAQRIRRGRSRLLTMAIHVIIRRMASALDVDPGFGKHFFGRLNLTQLPFESILPLEDTWGC